MLREFFKFAKAGKLRNDKVRLFWRIIFEGCIS
jgi:hypothetical protein